MYVGHLHTVHIHVHVCTCMSHYHFSSFCYLHVDDSLHKLFFHTPPFILPSQILGDRTAENDPPEMSASAGKESGKAPPSQGVAAGVAAASNGSAPLSRKPMETSQKRVLFQISEDSTMDDSPPQTPNNNGELSDSVFTTTETGASNGSDVGNLKQKKPGR